VRSSRNSEEHDKANIKKLCRSLRNITVLAARYFLTT
jgi:hypothetical protein